MVGTVVKKCAERHTMMAYQERVNVVGWLYSNSPFRYSARYATPTQ